MKTINVVFRFNFSKIMRFFLFFFFCLFPEMNWSYIFSNNDRNNFTSRTYKLQRLIRKDPVLRRKWELKSYRRTGVVVGQCLVHRRHLRCRLRIPLLIRSVLPISQLPCVRILCWEKIYRLSFWYDNLIQL